MGTIGRSSRVRRGRVSCAVWLGIGAGCGEPAVPLAGDELPAAQTVCAGDGECGPSARCLDGMCALACDASGLDVCGEVNTDAACDTLLGACVVPCVVSMACQVLGSGYVCDQGRCRAASAPGSG